MSQQVTRLRDLTKDQKRSGLAAWLGWMFDGLDIHIYTLVATPFVAALLLNAGNDAGPDNVKEKSAIIQAAFLIGWAFGGAFFGRVGDILGRRKALVLTILTYACFTGLSAIAQNWWQLGIFRFLSALGIGGEWAVGASLLVETWPKKWRPWMAAVLQCAVNCGILIAVLAGYLLKNDESHRLIFLVGLLPAILTLWIRRAVPETEEWAHAKGDAKPPGIGALFSREVFPVTWRLLLICGVSLTAHWCFLFWQQSFLRSLPEVQAMDSAGQNAVAADGLLWIMMGSLIGNFLAGGVAIWLGYRKALAFLFVGYFLSMIAAFHWTWSLSATLWWFALIGLFHGVFGLFTMCLPPLFPTLIRTTGAGFCFNFGRVVAAGGTVFFGLFSKIGDTREALYYSSFLFVAATLLAFMLPLEKEEGPLSPRE